MEDSTKNIELLDRFMVNERKSKLWTIINISIFCLLGLSIFFLAYKLNQSNAQYKRINVELEKKQDSLDAALAQVSFLNESLKQVSFTLTRWAGNYDSLKNVLDTVLTLLKDAKKGGQSNLPISNNIKNIITVERPPTSKDPGYTVFVQCMPGFEKLMPPLVKDLKERKYKVPRWEVVKGVMFDPVIKYFNDEDASEAKKLAAIINKSDEYFQKNPVMIQKLNLKSPHRQIEIWVGEYRQKDLKQLIKPCPPNC